MSRATSEQHSGSVCGLYLTVFPLQPSLGPSKLRRSIKWSIPPPSCMQLALLPRILLRRSRAHRARGPSEAHDVGRRRAMCLLHLHIGSPLPDRESHQRLAVRRGCHRLFLLVLCVLRDLLAGEHFFHPLAHAFMLTLFQGCALVVPDRNQQSVYAHQGRSARCRI